MLHTTGYQKLLYGKENITLMRLNNQYVPSLRLSMTECILVVILKNNSSKPAVYRPCSLSTCCINEPVSGLGSLLCICCSNSECGETNLCRTNKTHRSSGTTRGRPMFDVNSKFAAATMVRKCQNAKRCKATCILIFSLTTNFLITKSCLSRNNTETPCEEHVKL